MAGWEQLLAQQPVIGEGIGKTLWAIEEARNERKRTALLDAATAARDQRERERFAWDQEQQRTQAERQAQTDQALQLAGALKALKKDPLLAPRVMPALSAAGVMPEGADWTALSPEEISAGAGQALGMLRSQAGHLFPADYWDEDTGPLMTVAGADGRPAFATRGQVVEQGLQPYVKPDAPDKPPQPQLVDVPQPDGTVQQMWLKPGETVGPTVGQATRPKTDVRGEQQLRKEFRGLQSVKDYETSLPLLVSARRAPKTPAGDLQIIYTVGKVFDPGSVVREGELQLTTNAQPWLRKVVGQYEKQLKGGAVLDDGVRAQFLDALNERVMGYRQAYQRDYDLYADLAGKSGFTPQNVVGKHAANAYPPSPKAPAQAPADKFVKGRVYTDAQGNRARYLGNGKWQEQ